MQQSTCRGVAINKQSTRLDKEEEEEKKKKFNFAFFSLCFNAATIAAGKEVEKAAAGEPEWAGYGYGDIATDATATEEGPRLTRTPKWSGRREVGYKGGRLCRLAGRGASRQRRGGAIQQSIHGGAVIS